MKKIIMIIVIFSVFITLYSCSKGEKNPSIGKPVLAKSVDKETSMPIETAESFSQSDPAVYFTIKITDLPKGTKLKALWKYIPDSTEIPSEIIAEGTGYEAFTLKKSGELFPTGQYEVTVTGEADGIPLEAKGSFYITSEAAPTHLQNPLTSKTVDSEDSLNPVDITSKFLQSDPVIYFIVQSTDLPENTRVSCVWVYLDSGDSLSHEMTADGNRNIAFTLKPNPGEDLPAGRYRVTASVTIDNETESVSREFEIQ